MINELLTQLGFSDKEIQIYITILEHGKITPAEVAKLTRINRTTVYAIAKDLLKRGVISEDLGDTSSRLVALPPRQLGIIAKREERQLEEKRQIIDKAVAELQTIAKATKYVVPKISFINEEQLDDYLYERTPEWVRSISEVGENIAWGFQDPSFVVDYQEWIDWYWSKINPPTMKWQLLTNQAPVEKEMENKAYRARNTQFWDTQAQFSATTWVCGDYLIMITTKPRPHSLVEIYDKTLAHNMRELFKGIWKQLEDKKTAK